MTPPRVATPPDAILRHLRPRRRPRSLRVAVDVREVKRQERERRVMRWFAAALPR